MNKHKNFKDDALTADWLRDNGIAVNSFAVTDVKLLRAQKTAHILLTQNNDLLTTSQVKKLKAFQSTMSNKKARAKLKPDHAYSIFNINTKINRQLFKQYKKL